MTLQRCKNKRKRKETKTKMKMKLKKRLQTYFKFQKKRRVPFAQNAFKCASPFSILFIKKTEREKEEDGPPTSRVPLCK